MRRHRAQTISTAAAWAALIGLSACSDEPRPAATDSGHNDAAVAHDAADGGGEVAGDAAADVQADQVDSEAGALDAGGDVEPTTPDADGAAEVADVLEADGVAADADTGELADSSDGAGTDAADPAFAVAIQTPATGVALSAGTPQPWQVQLTGSASQLTAAVLAWNVANADGSNPQGISGAPLQAAADGSAQAAIQLAPGVRRLTIDAAVPAGPQASAQRLVLACPGAAPTIAKVDGPALVDGVVAAGGKAVVSVAITGVAGPGAKLQIVSDVDGVVGEAPIPADLAAGALVQVEASPTAKGVQAWSARVVGADATCASGPAATVQVCAFEIAESFSSDPTSAWIKDGDAYWDPSGWLELTGNATSKGGAFYHKALHVQPGDVLIEFRFATGGGSNGGADGYALTILETNTPADVPAYLTQTGDGGCLGYGVSGACGKANVKAFHVEIDTWVNKGDPNDDPSELAGTSNTTAGTGNHIAVHSNGDAGNALLWLPGPGKPAIQLEDLVWRTLSVRVQGEVLTIRLDEQIVATKSVSGLDFRGGTVILSGSTGWATNYHRLDDLRILHQCL